MCFLKNTSVKAFDDALKFSEKFAPHISNHFYQIVPQI
jgi:hypothetical protein